jgi:hypothetical protein
MADYSTKKISRKLISEITKSLKNKTWGSVEIYIQDGCVTQITERVIRKTSPKRKTRA